MRGRRAARQGGRWWRLLVLALGAALGGDLLLWAGHVVWREAAMRELEPLAGQIEALAEQIAEDDAWLSKNQRLLQGYGQHGELARRLAERGRRAEAHAALVEAYDRRVRKAYRRFYLAPVPAPRPPILQPSLPVHEGILPTR